MYPRSDDGWAIGLGRRTQPPSALRSAASNRPWRSCNGAWDRPAFRRPRRTLDRLPSRRRWRRTHDDRLTPRQDRPRCSSRSPRSPHPSQHPSQSSHLTCRACPDQMRRPDEATSLTQPQSAHTAQRGSTQGLGRRRWWRARGGSGELGQAALQGGEARLRGLQAPALLGHHGRWRALYELGVGELLLQAADLLEELLLLAL